MYDAPREYARMRLEEGGSPYRTTVANKEYKLCETYPRVLVIP